MSLMRSDKSLVTVIVLLCLAGSWLSGELVRHHIDPGSAGLLTHVCEAVSDGSCATTLDSRFSEIMLLGRVVVPVAFLGLAYFVFIGAWFGLVGSARSTGRPPWHRLPRHVGGCGLAMSAAYLGVMALGFADWCVACTAVHVVNAIVVVLVWRLTGDSRRGTGGIAAPLNTRQALNAVAVAAILIGGLWLYRHETLLHRAQRDRLLPYRALVTALRQDPEILLREFFSQPIHEIPPRATESPGESRLVVFTDYQCPACACHAASFQEPVTALFEGRLSVQVRHFPLSSDCNDAVDSAIHPDACRAARAAEAARRQGGEAAFRRTHELLFEHRHRLGDDLYRELADGLGLDVDLLLLEMESDEVRRIVAADIELAQTLGVTGTPAVFLDGRRVPELCRDSAVFWKAYAGVTTAPAAQERLARDP